MNVIKSILVLSLLFSSIFSKEIVLVADVWAPYTMEPSSGKEGYLIELLKTIFHAKGYQVTYIVRPYSRAIQMVQDGRADAVVGIYRPDAKKLGMLTPTNELGISKNTFYSRNEDTWNYDSQKGDFAFEDIRIGVIQSYIFEEIEEYLQANKGTKSVQYIHGEEPLKQNFTKLLGKRIDVILDDSIVIRHTARELGVEDQIRPAGSLMKSNEITVGFTNKNPASATLVELLSLGVETLRKNGMLEQILNSYDLSDWKR